MIDLNQVSKQYREVKALAGLSVSIEGGIACLLGPNGAGKSTTLRLISGFIAPSAGTVQVMGCNPLHENTRRNIGYLPEGAPLAPEATVSEILIFYARIRDIPRPHRQKQLDALVERLDLGPLRHRIIETLSKGQRRRVALAAAVLGDPAVLVLDEPTEGLDPNQRDEAHGLIRELAPRRTILLSTHILDEAERLCGRALILSNGVLVADGSTQGLARLSKHHGAVRVTATHDVDLAEAAMLIGGLPSVLEVEIEASPRQLLAIARPGANPMHDISALISEDRLVVEGLQVQSGRLEEVFRSLTRPVTQP